MDSPAKTLKKRMSKSFKAMLNTMDDGRLPTLDSVASWCEDAAAHGHFARPGQRTFSLIPR